MPSCFPKNYWIFTWFFFSNYFGQRRGVCVHSRLHHHQKQTTIIIFRLYKYTPFSNKLSSSRIKKPSRSQKFTSLFWIQQIVVVDLEHIILILRFCCDVREVHTQNSGREKMCVNSMQNILSFWCQEQKVIFAHLSRQRTQPKLV